MCVIYSFIYIYVYWFTYWRIDTEPVDAHVLWIFAWAIWSKIYTFDSSGAGSICSASTLVSLLLTGTNTSGLPLGTPKSKDLLLARSKVCHLATIKIEWVPWKSSWLSGFIFNQLKPKIKSNEWYIIQCPFFQCTWGWICMRALSQERRPFAKSHASLSTRICISHLWASQEVLHCHMATWIVGSYG